MVKLLTWSSRLQRFWESSNFQKLHKHLLMLLVNFKRLFRNNHPNNQLTFSLLIFYKAKLQTFKSIKLRWRLIKSNYRESKKKKCSRFKKKSLKQKKNWKSIKTILQCHWIVCSRFIQSWETSGVDKTMLKTCWSSSQPSSNSLNRAVNI